MCVCFVLRHGRAKFANAMHCSEPTACKMPPHVFISVLSVFCQCFASVLPVFCQCFASVFKATTQIFKLHSGVRDREGSKNMQNVNFQCLAVFCQCFASVLPVFCQCFASVFKATTQIFKLHSGVRDREGSKNMQHVNFQCLAMCCQCFASVLQVFCQCFASPPGAFFVLVSV